MSSTALPEGQMSDGDFFRTLDSAGSKIVLVPDAELRSLESRPPLRQYIARLHDRRHFIALDARARAFASSRDMLLGKLWLVIQPLLDAAMYGVLFGYILKTSRGIDNFVGYLILGITFFGFISSLMGAGIGLLRGSRGLISSFRFPIASLVLSRSYRSLLDAIPASLVSIVAALAMQFSTSVSWTVILVIPIFILLHLFGTGLMFISARLTAQIPDMRVIIQLFSRAWFFISGVFFSIDRFVDQEVLKAVMEANPAYIFLTAIRDSVIYHTVPSVSVWLTLLVWSLATFVLGFVYFWRAEDSYVNVR